MQSPARSKAMSTRSSSKVSVFLIQGWACARGSTKSIKVEAFAGGASGQSRKLGWSMANRASEAGVAKACGVAQGRFRFTIQVPKATWGKHGGKKVWVSGIAVGVGTAVLAQSGKRALPIPTKGLGPGGSGSTGGQNNDGGTGPGGMNDAHDGDPSNDNGGLSNDPMGQGRPGYNNYPGNTTLEEKLMNKLVKKTAKLVGLVLGRDRGAGGTARSSYPSRR